MSVEPGNDLRFEIGHVLFIDLVGYSKLLIEEQRERLGQLTEIVLATSQVREASNEQLVKLPTGDGMALVFRNSSDEPARCALEIAEALKKHPEIPVRMGIHSGPVSNVTDVTGGSNLAGAGINMAQRVMDCGDAGHILLSQRVAEDLMQYRQWASRLHDLGECEVKHGVRLHLVNLYAEQIGNAAMPEKFRKSKTTQSGPGTIAPERPAWRSFNPVAALAILVVVALGAGLYLFEHRSASKAALPPTAAAPSVIPEKSIAVLPFENLSSNKENAYFADGVQDEILTNLARIADLKVISRTSVMQFKDAAARKLPEIAEALKVAHVLEGSVQRSANRVRVNAQLIDARTDAHLWAQTYDRDLADVFAIQSEIAKSIADQLQAQLSPKEEAGLQAKPTKDLVAYDLFLRAAEIGHKIVSSVGVSGAEANRSAVSLLEAATQRDPAFVPALCFLAQAHLYLYFQGNEHTPERLAAAQKALDQAARVQPDSGDVHYGRGILNYWGHRDYDAALKELEAARRELPNDSSIIYWIGLIKRRQGHWDEALRDMEQALTSDPRNGSIISETAETYAVLGRVPEAMRIVDNALKWDAIDFGLLQLRASFDMYAKANLGPLKALVTSEAVQVASESELVNCRFDLAMLERDYHTARTLLAGGKVAEFDNNGFFVPKEWNEALIASGLGDEAKAKAQYAIARERAAAKVTAQPEDPQAVIVLGQLDAALGRKEEAIREGERATGLLPIAKDSIVGAQIASRLAGIYTQVGEIDRAVELLDKVARIPFAAGYGELKLERTWDPLRQDPRFEKIVQSLAPK
jgi:TolB-like protein/Tfp pilus assembly protein PilF